MYVAILSRFLTYSCYVPISSEDVEVALKTMDTDLISDLTSVVEFADPA
jgi:hypothetical protein